jgi:membrane protein
MSNVKHHPFARNRSAAKPAEPVGPGEPARAQRPPQSPTDLPRPAWTAVLKRALVQFKHDDITDRAAALTYFGVLALFPGVLVLVSILGLLGRSTTDKVLTNIDQLAPGGVRTFLRDVVHQTQGRTGAAGAAAIIGVIVALWSASGYIAAFMRASNTIYGVDEGRPIWKTAPVRLAVTIAVVIMLVISAVIVVFTGSVASQFGHALGVGDTGVLIWDIVKWPVLLVVVSVMFSLLYWACPNVRQPGFRWITPGGVLAVVVWLVASGAFALYVSFAGSYNKTYGSLATVIIFLVWLWITNIAILLGAQFNAETEHQRAIQAGLPEEVEPFVAVRDTRKLSEDEQRRVAVADRARGRAAAD